MSSKRLLLFDFADEEHAQRWSEGTEVGRIKAFEVRCATCRHFDGAQQSQYLDRYTDRPTGFGECTAFPGVAPVLPDDLAATYDGEGYMSGLHVRPEFGCIAWEARE